MADLPAQPPQAVAGGLLRRFELRGDRFELDADGGEALEQRVVDLAAHARALCKDQRILVRTARSRNHQVAANTSITPSTNDASELAVFDRKAAQPRTPTALRSVHSPLAVVLTRKR